MKQGEPELIEVIMGLFTRIERLESNIEYLLNKDEKAKEVQIVSQAQLDELTSQVEQNLTRKLRERMAGKP
jgi:hypothetical protein